MSQVPSELKYTKDHEWLRLDADGTATVGITDYAQSSLGDVTFVELPELGASLDAGSAFGVVESVKAASDIYMPASGEIVEVNGELADSPDLVNSDPYGKGWLVRVRLSDASSVAALLDSAAYGALV
ncbi:MAG: glycine cleavage system protein GcvH [Opitutales bacterium]|nr:glycine cleavage system protein GcvH [Opitutales bacterium]